MGYTTGGVWVSDDSDTYCSPPPCIWDTAYGRAFCFLLGRVKESRESEDSHGDEEKNAAGLLVTLPKGETKSPHAG